MHLAITDTGIRSIEITMQQDNEFHCSYRSVPLNYYVKYIAPGHGYQVNGVQIQTNTNNSNTTGESFLQQKWPKGNIDVG